MKAGTPVSATSPSPTTGHAAIHCTASNSQQRQHIDDLGCPVAARNRAAQPRPACICKAVCTLCGSSHTENTERHTAFSSPSPLGYRSSSRSRPQHTHLPSVSSRLSAAPRRRPPAPGTPLRRAGAPAFRSALGAAGRLRPGEPHDGLQPVRSKDALHFSTFPEPKKSHFPPFFKTLRSHHRASHRVGPSRRWSRPPPGGPR